MISKPRQLSMWKSILNEKLGANWRKYFTHIAVTLECVSKGLKAAFLWDVGPSVTPGRLADVVQALKSKDLLCKDVYVMVLVGDPLIVNLATLRETIREFRSRRRVFVDVTGSVAIPVEPGSDTDKKCRNLLTSVSEKVSRLNLSDANSEQACLGLEEDWCVPSLFGILSGYPVVYWYDPMTCDNPVCLNGAPLQVYRMIVKTRRNGGEIRVYSFSVPWTFVQMSRKIVDDWFASISGKFRGHNWLSSLEIMGEKVILPSVAL